MSGPPDNAEGPGEGENGMNVDTLSELSKLQIWEKLRRGALHSITRKNVEELFQILDAENKGSVSKTELFALRQVPGLALTEDDIYALADDCDKDDSGHITVEELYQGLTQGELAFTMIKASLGKAAKLVDEKSVLTQEVINYLQEEYDTGEALWSLPQTFILFALFMLLMSGHVDVTTAFQMQTALTNEINAEAQPPWAFDVPTYWTWMTTSFSDCYFKQDLVNFPFPGRVGSYNQIIGGVQLVKTFVTAAAPCAQSEALREQYDSITGGLCFRDGPTDTDRQFLLYHVNSSIIIDQLTNLSSLPWVDQNVSSVDVHTLFYNAHLEAFTDSHILFDFDGSGALNVIMAMETFKADPYFNKLWIAADVMFVGILLKMFYGESREMVPAIVNGMDAFLQYLEFWNFVDWVSIILGAVVTVYWGMVTSQVGGQLQNLMSELPTKELDDQVFNRSAYLTYEDVDTVPGGRAGVEDLIGQIHKVSQNAADNHESLRTLMFWYSFVLMMKFFKAFQANPRLDIVIRTLTKSAVEIAHFMIVFAVIFLCFTSAAHVIFGKTIPGFMSQYEAVIMGWRVLMGEFDALSMEEVNFWLADLWLAGFQFLVFLILLNMLLAIIMDTYVAAKEEKGDPSEQLTIWNQIRLACIAVKETRGHLPLYTLLLELLNEAAPAHPHPTMTAKSIRRAFRNMSRHQADYIMKHTVQFIKAQEQKVDLTFSDAIRVLSLLKVNMLRNVNDTQAILEIMKQQQNREQKNEARLDAILNGDDPDEVAKQATGSRSVKEGVHFSQYPPTPTTDQAGARRPSSHSHYGNVFLPTGHSTPIRSDHGDQTPMSAAASGFMASALANTGDGMGGAARFAGGGGGNSSFANELELLALQNGLQAIMDQQLRMVDTIERRHKGIQSVLDDQRRYMQEHDARLQERLQAVDAKMAAAEEGTNRVLSAIEGVDFTDFAALPGKLEQLMPKRDQRGMGAHYVSEALGHTHSHQHQHEPGPGTMIEDRPLSRGRTPGGRPGGGSRPPDLPATTAAGAHLEEQVAVLAKQVQLLASAREKQFQELLSRAEEAAEIRKMLFKIEQNLRQLRERGFVDQPSLQAPSFSRTGSAEPPRLENHRSSSSVGSQGGQVSGTPSRLPPPPIPSRPSNGSMEAPQRPTSSLEQRSRVRPSDISTLR